MFRYLMLPKKDQIGQRTQIFKQIVLISTIISSRRGCASALGKGGYFHPCLSQLPATELRDTLNQRFESWRALAGLHAATQTSIQSLILKHSA